MPKQEPDLNVTVDDLVAAIKRRLTELDRTPAWLAKRIGVNDQSLRNWLDRPELLRVTVWLAILHALDMTAEDVLQTRAA